MSSSRPSRAKDGKSRWQAVDSPPENSNKIAAANQFLLDFPPTTSIPPPSVPPSNQNSNIPPPPPSLMSMSLPMPPPVPPPSQKGRLPPPNANHPLLGGVHPPLFKPNQLMAVPTSLPLNVPTSIQLGVPTNIPLGIFAGSGGQPITPSLAGFFNPNQQQQNLLPNPLLAQQSIDLVNNFLGTQKMVASLNNAIIDQLNQQRQQQNNNSDNSHQPRPVPPAPQPVAPPPPLSPSTSSNGIHSLMIPPPPPPPNQPNVRCGLDSPMDIEDEDEDNQASEREGGNYRGNARKGRSKNVQMADELMKKALKPYFSKRRISKEEYKEIMKKGVGKLKKRSSLRAEKVEKFVAMYVQSFVNRRKAAHFGH